MRIVIVLSSLNSIFSIALVYSYCQGEVNLVPIKFNCTLKFTRMQSVGGLELDEGLQEEL